MVAFADTRFAKANRSGTNLRVYRRGEWRGRLLVEIVLSMLTQVYHLEKIRYRCRAYFKTRLAFTMMAFNLLGRWAGLSIDEDGLPLSIAQFSF